MELIFGSQNGTEQQQTEKWLARCRVAWLDATGSEEAITAFRKYHLGNAIGVLDMLIAQVAISLQVPLHTFNQKHFNTITELHTVRPYARRV